MKILALLPVLFFTLCGSVFAQDSGLYEQIPEGASFVRVLSISGDEAEQYSLNGKRIESVQVGAYHPITAKSVRLDNQGIAIDKDIEAEKFYSFIDTPNGDVLFLEDERLVNQAKSVIHFYNLTDRLTLSLKANDGKIAIAMANQNDAGSREINPVSAKLAIYEDKTPIIDVPETILGRGKATTIVAYGTGTDITVISEPSHMKP